MIRRKKAGKMYIYARTGQGGRLRNRGGRDAKRKSCVELEGLFFEGEGGRGGGKANIRFLGYRFPFPIFRLLRIPLRS